MKARKPPVPVKPEMSVRDRLIAKGLVRPNAYPTKTLTCRFCGGQFTVLADRIAAGCSNFRECRERWETAQIPLGGAKQ